MRLRLGTRGSALALAQSGTVARALEGLGAEVELVRIETAGDADQARPFAEIGEPGVFVRALERALSDGRIDLAVHSYKDLPSQSPPELAVAAAPERADPRDRLLVRTGAFQAGAPALPLADGARVGTSSARRAALLRDLRPDLATLLLRGNVDTRLAKVERGDYDAILLAAAGLDRLGRPKVGKPLSVDVMLPAPGQGAIGIECRADDGETCSTLARLDVHLTSSAVRAERAFVAALGGSCHSPVAALAEVHDGQVHLRAEILSEDGKDCVADEARFPIGDERAAAGLAKAMLGRAPESIRRLFA